MDQYQPTPIWLADRDMPAPCPCGRPMMIGEPIALVEGEHNLKRMVHASCLQAMMAQNPPDDDDEA